MKTQPKVSSVAITPTFRAAWPKDGSRLQKAHGCLLVKDTGSLGEEPRGICAQQRSQWAAPVQRQMFHPAEA